MADDSGAAAVMVKPELKELRETCDRLDIKWHPRHKAETLRDKINECQIGTTTNTFGIDKMTATEVVAIKHPKKPRPKPRPKRSIPQDVLEALEYMDAYSKARGGRVREYIESLL